MNISDIVEYKIDRFKSGYVFTYNDFFISVDKVNALKKALSRLVASGKIVRLSKGKYYKPKEGIIGDLMPDEYQIVKDLLEDEGKLIGYLSGFSAFNKLGLTTQVSNTIQIGTNIDKKSIKRGKYTIRFIRQRNTINKDTIFILQILDSIRFIKRIPDANINTSCERLKNIIQDLSDSDLDYMLKLAIKYNPATRALTGAILELIKGEAYVALLYKTLRITTTFDLNISEETLKNKDKWQIR
jgi:hypothetical protein